ncbi:MAG: O-antigen ligase family protein [Candidatus Doudnabacteria bacterium]|jgi:O-antigen ligase
MISLLIATLLLAPAYGLKFHLANLPTNILMVWVFLFWLIFFIYLLLKKQFVQYLSARNNWSKPILIFTGLFLLSGAVSLFVKGITLEKLGQFIVLFLQPISIFFIAGFIFQKTPATKYYILNTIYLILAFAGLLAIIQYLTLWGLPQAFWGNSIEPKRAVSFFIHPNFYSLWCAPLLAFLIPDLRFKVENLRKNWAVITSWMVGIIGLLLSLSRAGWLGLGAAILVYLIIAADKKIRKLASIIVIVLVMIIVSVPNFRWRFTLPFYGEKSAVSRLSLWNTGWKGIKESPVTGLGLTGFSQQWQTLNTDPNLDTHNFPHNIFLDFWVETGLLGLISFIGIASLFIYNGLKNRRDIYKLSVALFLIAIIFSGLVDNPYFKNDLAMVFWIVLSIFL